MNSFYSEEELKQLGLGGYGRNVLISRKTSIYGAAKIRSINAGIPSGELEKRSKQPLVLEKRLVRS